MLIQQQHNSPTTEVQQGEILIQQQLILTNHEHSPTRNINSSITKYSPPTHIHKGTIQKLCHQFLAMTFI